MSAALKTTEDLGDRLAAICDAQPFRTRYWAKRLDTGEVFGREAAVRTPSASTRKVAIMMAALKGVHEGRLDMEEPIVLEERLKVDVASGTYRYMTTGTVMPLRDAITNMIITSDNCCTQMVLERLSLDGMNAYLADLGMVDTRVVHMLPPIDAPADHPVEEGSFTSAADQGHLLSLILAGVDDPAVAARLGSTPAWCRYALEVLSWQKLREQIPALLPYGTRVANKTGRGKRGRMDVGIVWRGDTPAYILAGFTDEIPPAMPDGLPGHAAAFRTVALLSRACWDATA